MQENRWSNEPSFDISAIIGFVFIFFVCMIMIKSIFWLFLGHEDYNQIIIVFGFLYQALLKII